jgi:hypothetical protein
MRSSKTTSNSRGGYTLFEMLMVQGLLVMMVAASWPMLRSPLGKNQLVDAARQIRVELVKARHKAMETGVAQQFRFQPGSKTFEVTPVVAKKPNALERVARRGLPVAGDDSADAAIDRESELLDVVHRDLPRGVRFCDAVEPASEAEQGDAPADRAASAARRDAVLGTEDEEWSTPILFHPNGRTSDAKIRLKGKRNFEIEVALRGLTGIPSVGEAHRAEEEK